MKSKAEKFFERSEVSFDSRINYDARTLAAKLTLKRHGRPLMPKGGPNYPYSATFRISWDQGPHTNEEYLEWSRQDYRFTDQTDFSYLTDRMTRYAENFSHELGVEIGEAPHAVDFYSLIISIRAQLNRDFFQKEAHQGTKLKPVLFHKYFRSLRVS